MGKGLGFIWKDVMLPYGTLSCTGLNLLCNLCVTF